MRRREEESGSTVTWSKSLPQNPERSVLSDYGEDSGADVIKQSEILKRDFSELLQTLYGFI